jgi:hypothetical protein
MSSLRFRESPGGVLKRVSGLLMLSCGKVGMSRALVKLGRLLAWTSGHANPLLLKTSNWHQWLHGGKSQFQALLSCAGP